MYKHITVNLLGLHLPMALNANIFGFYVGSCKYIYSYVNFHDHVEKLNSTYLFSNAWYFYTFQQPWKVSNNFAYLVL